MAQIHSTLIRPRVRSSHLSQVSVEWGVEAPRVTCLRGTPVITYNGLGITLPLRPRGRDGHYHHLLTSPVLIHQMWKRMRMGNFRHPVWWPRGRFYEAWLLSRSRGLPRFVQPHYPHVGLIVHHHIGKWGSKQRASESCKDTFPRASGSTK